MNSIQRFNRLKRHLVEVMQFNGVGRAILAWPARPKFAVGRSHKTITVQLGPFPRRTRNRETFDSKNQLVLIPVGAFVFGCADFGVCGLAQPPTFADFDFKEIFLLQFPGRARNRRP